MVWSFVYLALAASSTWSRSAVGRPRRRRSRSSCCATNWRCCVARIHGPGCSPGSGPAGSAEPPPPSSPLVGVPGQARDAARPASAHGAPTVDLPDCFEWTAASSRLGGAAGRPARPGESAVGLPADLWRTAPPWLPDLGQLHPQGAACHSVRRCLALDRCRDYLHADWAPNANAVAERWVGTVRRECLNHLLIVGRQHLARILYGYVEHYNQHRPHRSLGLGTPIPSVRGDPSECAGRSSTASSRDPRRTGPRVRVGGSAPPPDLVGQEPVGDPHRDRHHQRHREPQRPLPPLSQGRRPLPQRAGRAQAPVPDHRQPGTTGRGRRRWTNRWKAAPNTFDIAFDGRVSAGRKWPYPTIYTVRLNRPGPACWAPRRAVVTS